MAGAAPKEYGLITRKKPTSGAAAVAQLANTPFARASRLAAFASDSDDDDDATGKASAAAAVSAAASKVNLSLGALQQRQIRKAQQTALADDPTIYQYDELYDDIQAKRDTAKASAQQASQQADPKRPKYIERLLVTAESRKKEYERRIERQVQKERDAEGAQFADKESFVTASYRAKLEEMRAAEAAEQRDEYLEAIGDVTKQRDLGGFYRHLYEQKMGADDGGDGATAAEASKPVTEDMKKLRVTATERTYRKRKAEVVDGQSEDEEADAGGEAKKDGPASSQHIQSNLDADSDFSIDSSSSSDEEDDGRKKTTTDAATKPDNPAPKSIAASSKPPTEDSETFVKPSVPDAVKVDDPLPPTVLEELPPPKPVKIKVNIWLKRTVGDVLEAAIERYHERKRARASN